MADLISVSKLLREVFSGIRMIDRESAEWSEVLVLPSDVYWVRKWFNYTVTTLQECSCSCNCTTYTNEDRTPHYANEDRTPHYDSFFPDRLESYAHILQAIDFFNTYAIDSTLELLKTDTVALHEYDGCLTVNTRLGYRTPDTASGYPYTTVTVKYTTSQPVKASYEPPSQPEYLLTR